jgi:tripartite-type tricarboxylate transporter receptor subunit TctC
VRKGKLVALAVTTPTRSPALPSVPPLTEAVPGYEASAVTGIGSPRRTPPEIIAMLNAAINAGFADPGMKARLADTGGEPLPGSAAEFGRILVAETEKWGRVVKSAGIKAE